MVSALAGDGLPEEKVMVGYGLNHARCSNSKLQFEEQQEM